jgi:hypothetical protein
MTNEVFYACAECGTQVRVVDGEIVSRPCAHLNAPVTADIEAEVYGQGGAGG